MKPPSLSALRKGDVLILRDGTRRTFAFYTYPGTGICSEGMDSPWIWRKDGKHSLVNNDKHDIVRVVRARVKKVKPDRDAAFLLRIIATEQWRDSSQRNLSNHQLRRLRRIAKRLEQPPKGTT